MSSAPDVRRAVRREQAVHQRLQPVGLLDDDLRVFAQLGSVELALEQLRRAAQAAQRVLDLVREVADQLAVGLLLVDQPLLARQAQLLLDRPQLRRAAARRSASMRVTVQDSGSGSRPGRA